MNYRVNTRVIIILTVFVIIAGILFAYTLIHAPTTDEVTSEVSIATTTKKDTTPHMLITAKHQYKNGTHILAGVVSVPTVCHRLVTEPFFLEDGNVVEIRFSTLLVGEECAATPTDARFLVTFDAPEDVNITGIFDGSPVRLNLVPVAEGEDIDQELYIKG